MQVRTKKSLIEKFKGHIAYILLKGPKEKEDQLIKVAKKCGFDISDSTPWKDAFPEYSDEQLPGIALAGARHREGLTQKQLADMINIPQSHISEMERGKRPIGKNMAKRLAEVLNVGYKIFL